MKKRFILSVLLLIFVAACSRSTGRLIVRGNSSCIKGVVTEFIGEKERIVVKEYDSDLEWEFPVQKDAASDILIGQDVELSFGDVSESVAKIKRLPKRKH